MYTVLVKVSKRYVLQFLLARPDKFGGIKIIIIKITNTYRMSSTGKWEDIIISGFLVKTL